MFEEEKTITLRKPLTIGKGDGSITYTELKLREPTAGELEKASKADTGFGVTINLISIIAKIPRTAVEQLTQRDLMAANEFLGTFTEAGQPEAEAGQT